MKSAKNAEVSDFNGIVVTEQSPWRNNSQEIFSTHNSPVDPRKYSFGNMPHRRQLDDLTDTLNKYFTCWLNTDFDNEFYF